MSVGIDIENYLGQNCENRLIAVEYVGGDCCKKAVGILGSVAPNYIELISNTDTCPYVGITVYNRNSQTIQERAENMIIMKNNIISIESEPYVNYRLRRDSEVDTNKNLVHTPEVDVLGEYLLQESEQKSEIIRDCEEEKQEIDKLAILGTKQNELVFKTLSEDSSWNYVTENESFIEEPEDSWDEEE